MIIILEEDYSKEIANLLKMWTSDGRITLSNGIYNISPVYNKVIIFSISSISEYFKSDPLTEFSMNLRFKKKELNSGKDIKKFIKEINNDL